MLADYDDILTPRSLIQKLLLRKFPSCCASKDQASLWIDHSIQVGVISEVRRCNQTSKLLVLPKYKHLAANVPFPAGVDTFEAESFVKYLLQKQGGGMDRRAVNDALVKEFPHQMINPLIRGSVMRNGSHNKAFVIVKQASWQVVGLSREDAQIALESFQDKLLPGKEALPLNGDESSTSLWESAKEHDSQREDSIPREDYISSGAECGDTPISTLTLEEMKAVQERVVSVISMLADYDDILPSRFLIQKLLLEKFPSCCAAKDQASLWIDHSIQVGVISEVRRCNPTKSKALMLPKYKHLVANVPFPASVDTFEAESFVKYLLQKQGGGMDRRAVNDALVKEFPHQMTNPLIRASVMRNGSFNKAFVIVKQASWQVVGLSREDAQIALESFQDKLLPGKEALPLNGDESSTSLWESAKEHDAQREGSTPREEEISATKEQVD